MAFSPQSPSLSSLTIPTHSDPVTVVARWQGAALAVHPPIRDGQAIVRGQWAITHHASGLLAGTFHGTLKGAIKLARAWDQAFYDACGGDASPSLRTWTQRFAWLRQLDGTSAVVGPVPPDHDDHADRVGGTDHAEAGPTLPTIPRAHACASDGDGGEQFPATITIWPSSPGRVRFARALPDGRVRLRTDEGRPVKMNGDCAAFKNPANPLEPILRLWFKGQWHDVPSIAECMEWTLDGVCETPDGRRVEPDAPDAWLTLLGVV